SSAELGAARLGLQDPLLDPRELLLLAVGEPARAARRGGGAGRGLRAGQPALLLLPCFRPCLALLPQPAVQVVAALVLVDDAVALEDPQPRGDLVEEEPVVRDNQHAPRVV